MKTKTRLTSLGARVLALLLVVLLAAGTLAVAGCRPQLADDGQTGGTGDGEGTPGDGTQAGDDGSGGAPDDAGPDLVPCPLCGELVDAETLLHRPLAVSIDNQRDARPQSGLNDACLVYEVLAEGGITRFVAFFLHRDSATVGPVRSLRHYFLDLTMPLGAVIAHVGGSPQGLRDAVDLKPMAMTINEMVNGSAFRRSTSRKAPHNCYTGTDVLRSASVALGYEGQELSSPTPSAFDFAASAEEASLPSSSEGVSQFTVKYAGGENGYAVTYRYDSTGQVWLRSLGNTASVDLASGEQLQATTVIVQYVSSWVIPGDTEGRLDLALTGEGDAKFFTEGQVFDGTWSKAGRMQKIEYTTSSGDPIEFPPGPVWVLIVPPGSTVETN